MRIYAQPQRNSNRAPLTRKASSNAPRCHNFVVMTANLDPWVGQRKNRSALGARQPTEMDITLTGGQSVLTIDSGAFEPARIGDRVFVDLDEDGLFDTGEGIPNITVTLSDGQTTVTDADGFYEFLAVAGSYTVDFSIRVPASDAAEAERHARRLYEAQPFPWEHAVSDDRVRWHSAREVVS